MAFSRVSVATIRVCFRYFSAKNCIFFFSVSFLLYAHNPPGTCLLYNGLRSQTNRRRNLLAHGSRTTETDKYPSRHPGSVCSYTVLFFGTVVFAPIDKSWKKKTHTHDGRSIQFSNVRCLTE